MARALDVVACAVLLAAATATAGESSLQNDVFNFTGTVATPVSFPEYDGVGSLFEADAGAYPITLKAVDVFCAPFPGLGSSGDVGAYLIDVWDESGDAGIVPPVKQNGNRFSSGVQLTASLTRFNRFTFTPGPIVITSGKFFVAIREQLSTLDDGTTIAMDVGPVKPGANWWFAPNAGGWSMLTGQPDAGVAESLNRNWILRAVLNAPDVAPLVLSVSPASGANDVARNVNLTGNFFDLTSKVFLGTTELAVASRSLPTVLVATVPAGFTPGVYDVAVENAASPTALRGTLSNAYTVTSGGGAGGGAGGSGGGAGGAGGGSGGNGSGLRLDSVSPDTVQTGDDNELTLLGAGFQPDIQVLVGSKLTTAVDRKSGSVLTATLKAKTLIAGVYDVTVINSDGSDATLKDGLTVREGTSVPAGCKCTEVPGGTLAALLLVLRGFTRSNRKRA